MCCFGQGCRPAILPSILVDDCSLCTDQECRTIFPVNCPSESTAGAVDTHCIEDTTTTTTTTTEITTTRPSKLLKYALYTFKSFVLFKRT